MKILKLFILSQFFISTIFAQAQNGSFSIDKLTSSSQFVNLTKNLDVEEIGKLHNEGLDFILTGLIQQKIKSSDTRYASVSISLLNEFCKSKGIELNASFSGDFKQWQAEQPAGLCNVKNNISPESSKIICDINDAIEKLKAEQLSITEFSTLMDNNITLSKGLQQESERLLVGITASITKNSFQYWEKNFEIKFAQFDALEDDKSDNTTSGKEAPPKIRWWAVGLADAWGALNWGSGGAAIGGPAGAVAAGLVGACYQSGTSILVQHTIHAVTHH